jgi:hypothetical protein
MPRHLHYLYPLGGLQKGLRASFYQQRQARLAHYTSGLPDLQVDNFPFPSPFLSFRTEPLGLSMLSTCSVLYSQRFIFLYS